MEISLFSTSLEFVFVFPQNHVLALAAHLPDAEHLNEISLKLPLSDMAAKTLQTLNRQCTRAAATARERCRSDSPSRVPCPFRGNERLELSKVILYGSVLFVLNLYSELQGIRLNEKFLYCCEKWVQLLEKVEEMLKINIAGSLPGLLEQQKTCEVSLSATRRPSPWAGVREGQI